MTYCEITIMSTSLQNHIPYVPQDTLDPAAGLNEAIRVIDALLNTRVENMTQNAPTSADEVDGVCFIVGPVPTGVWAGHAKAIAQFVAEGAFWKFYEAGVEAWLVLNKTDNNLYKYNAATTAWELAAGIGEAPLDGNYYGRQNGTWGKMPNVANMVTSVNSQNPDTSGNVDVDTHTGNIQSVNGMTPDTSGDVNIQLGRLNGLNDQTGTSYTLLITDIGKDVRCSNASAIALTVPAEDTSHPWQIGDCIIFSQGDVGAVTATSDGTSVLQAANGSATTAQFDARVIEYLGSNTWRVW